MKLIKLAGAFFASIILLQSCLKDKGIHSEDFGSNSDISAVEFTDAESEIVVQGVDVLPATETINSVRVRVIASKPTTKDVVVTLALRPQLVIDYNAAHGTNFLNPATVNGYTLPDGLKITIPAGKQEGFLRLTVNKPALGFAAYGLGFEIVSADGYIVNSGNNKLIFGFLVKNKYDADYLRNGFYFHPNITVIGPYTDVVHVSTLGAIRCSAPHATVGGWLLQFDVDQATNALINWGHSNVPPPQSGFLTVENPTGTTYAWPANPSLQPGMGGYNVSTYNNTYNPNTRTFWMHYGHAVGGNGPSTWTRVIYDKLVRQ